MRMLCFATFALASLSGWAAPAVRPQAMKILPAGAVRPEGYLRTQLVRQAEGLTGHAEELYADIGKSAWLGVKDGDAWERGPYYLKGLLPLAFALDDPTLKARTRKWIDSILSLQQPNGYFSARPNNWWANMIALHVLRDWAEATGDKRVETFLARYFAYQREALKTTPLEKDSCWAIARGGDNLEIVLWLYDRTHDENLLELAALLAAQTQDWNCWYRTGEGSTGFAVHIVNFMQGLKFPALKWRLTGCEADRTAALAAFDPAGWAFSKHGRPDGMLNGTESLSGRAASQGTELCAVAERLLSDATSAAVTGDAAFGDRLESIAYNTLPGQVSPDLKGIRYYTLMNQPACLAESLDFRENGERVALSSDMHKAMQGAPAICPGPCAGYGCCRSNFHFAWPKFVQSLWMEKDGGLAAVAYGPCRVKYAGFDLHVTTDYPFRETVRVEVLSAPSAEAPLAFRIPQWTVGACVTVNGRATNGTIPGRFETLRRVWKAGDRIELMFPMEVLTTDGWSASGNALSVRRGPLVYAFAPQFRRHRLDQYSLPEFPTYELIPTEPWNWALVRAADGAVEAALADDGKPLAEQPFDPQTPPVSLCVKAVRTTVAGWGAMRSDKPGNACEPPASPLPLNAVSPVVDVIRLVPMGCTQVRIAEFPWKQAEVVAPRIILDSDRLDYVTFPQDQTEKLNSGWEMDGLAFVRPFNRQAAGVVRYTAVFALPADVTAELRFEDAKGNVLKGEKIVGGKEQPVCGAFQQDGALARVRLVPSNPVSPKGVLARPFRVTVDWAVDEGFTCGAAGRRDGHAGRVTLPAGWRGEKAAVVDLPYLACTAKNGEKGFDRPATDAVLEIAPGGWVDPLADDAGRSARGADPTAALLGEAYAFEFDALVEKNTDLAAAGVRLRDLYAFTPDIWYHFRFETNGEKTLLRLNGRLIAENVRTSGRVARPARPHDCTIENLSQSAKLLVDDVKAFALVSPADYPPAPVRVKGEEKWDVIMNVCSLWYNGRHAGWRCIERAGGPRPVLGYYDEGLPETADWEIKYMVDHGVDVQVFCWYPESHDGPIRHPHYEYQLRDGFKNARYSDRMKYCLIWEIENAGRPHTLEAWKKNYVPYLIEHHFKDPRYYAPDGKPMLAVFGGWNFPKRTAFGSAETTKAAFDYLEAELKKLGFKGLVTVSSNWHEGRDDLAACGFSARCAYNYGTEGWKVETQKTRNLARAAIPGAFVIPTVSVGYNSRPWHGKSYPMMSAADLKTSLAWVRDEFMPSQRHAEPWEARAVWLSTWNEYGEGTYLMPTDDALGFGYLDAVRSVFTEETPDPKLNIKPTDAQRARLCNLYREGR